MRTESEVRMAYNKIYNNKNLSMSYKEDVCFILNWVLGGENFDGLWEE